MNTRGGEDESESATPETSGVSNSVLLQQTLLWAAASACITADPASLDGSWCLEEVRQHIHI